jgi:hypothetical protein
MEIDEPLRTRTDNRHEQVLPGNDEGTNELVKRLGSNGIDKAFTGFLQQDVLAQVVVGQLLDKIDGLQNEVDSAKRTAITLASRMTAESRKRPASPTNRGLGDEDQRPYKIHG